MSSIVVLDLDHVTQVESLLRARIVLTQNMIRQSQQIVRLADLFAERLQDGQKLLFAGNGGSAADAQHLAAEYVVRFGRERSALSALALTTDSSILTACANDMDFSHIFARQIEALGCMDDVLVLHSTSGRSSNILQAAEMGKRLKLTVVVFTGEAGFVGYADEICMIPSKVTSHIQEMHLTIQHIIVGLVEQLLFGVGR